MSDLLADIPVRNKPIDGSGQTYARFVKVFRYVLGLAVLTIISAVLLWPEFERTAPIRIENPDQMVSKNELIKPKFESIDQSSQPFSLTADRAVQNHDDPDRVDLENPIGDITLRDGSILKLSAKSGFYRQEAQIMYLTGDVQMQQDNIYFLEGQTATINMKTQIVFSESPVKGAGPFGSIVAEGLSGNGESGILVFKGPAVLILKEGLAL